MSFVLSPGLTTVGRGHPLAVTLAIAMLAIPMVIATLALTPALVICPFLSAAQRRLVIRLLASLRQWTLTLTTVCGAASSERGGKATDDRNSVRSC